MPHFSLPLFGQVEEVPYQGNSVETRSASLSGAVAVVEIYAQRTSAYLQLLKQAGALTDHEAAALLKCGLSSINSVRGMYIKRMRQRGEPDPIVKDGFDRHALTVGGKQKLTRRTRWRLRP